MRNDILDSERQPSVEPNSESFSQYLNLVRRWNKKIGLVSAHDLAHLRDRHLDDSLALQTHTEGAASLIDIGAGGGFPGIPLALMNPDMKATLIERNHKKCSFLRHVVMVLKLRNVSVISADVRDVGEGLDRVDVVTARAVGRPDQIWAWSRDLLTQQGRLLLQTATPYEAGLDDATVEAFRSAGIGWINVVRRRSP